jgi:hypothetical protein
LEAYRRPVPAIYNVVLQELLVQQHFIRYNVNYQYNEVRTVERAPVGSCHIRTTLPLAAGSAAADQRRGHATPP